MEGGKKKTFGNVGKSGRKADATSLTESGYVGEDVENILLRLIQAADWDIPRAEQGIIYIDELDKIARKEGINRSITRDVAGEGVQQELLKIIEGCVANVPPQGGRKHPHQEMLQINTKNIVHLRRSFRRLAGDNLQASVIGIGDGIPGPEPGARRQKSEPCGDAGYGDARGPAAVWVHPRAGGTLAGGRGIAAIGP